MRPAEGGDAPFVRFFTSVDEACTWAEGKANELSASGYRVIRLDVKPVLLSIKTYDGSFFSDEIESLEERRYGAVAIVIGRR